LKNRLSTPFKTHPSQVLHRVERELPSAPQGIQILHAKQNTSASLHGTPAGGGKSEGVSEMQMPGGCGSKASKVIHGFSRKASTRWFKQG